MTLYERASAELQRRADLLSQEINTWMGRASSNIEGFGIHKSQFEQLKKMMDALLARQKLLLMNMDPALPKQQFAEHYLRLLREITGTHELWRVFSYIFNQLVEERLGPLVDAACLVAADCYLTVLNRARFRGVIAEGEFREPPLVYLEAELSPATASRGQKAQALGFPLGQYRQLRLPIPVVTLPLDQATSPWLFCSLHHEVGHNLDQDLKLGRELKQSLEQALKAAGVPSDRSLNWKKWSEEILADVFGVLLGGAGFAYSLSSFLMIVAPSSIVLVTNDEHPDPFVRIHLLVELLKRTGVNELNAVANKIVTDFDMLVKPAGLDAYRQDSPHVAEFFLKQPLKALKDNPLSDLVTDLARDVKMAEILNQYLRSGIGFDRPKEDVPFRLVPVASQLRLVELDAPSVADLDQIQQRSWSYLASLKRPEYLAAVDRHQFLNSLVDEIDFSTKEKL